MKKIWVVLVAIIATVLIAACDSGSDNLGEMLQNITEKLSENTVDATKVHEDMRQENEKVESVNRNGSEKNDEIIVAGDTEEATQEVKKEMTDGGRISDNVKWAYYDSTKTLIISGQGPMEDYVNHNYQPWTEYEITNVEVKSGITAIGGHSFEMQRSLVNVSIADTVSTINEGAFMGCESIEYSLPQNIKYIGDFAFFGSGIDGAELTEDIFIGTHAFYQTEIKSIDLPSSLVEIKDHMFMHSKIERIVIRENVKRIEAYAFYGCDNLNDVYYSGTEAQWQAIYIGKENDSLINANIHFNYTE